MGGEGAMRTIAKIAAVGFRGTVPHVQPSLENSSEMTSLHTAAPWDVDDWEVADGRGEATPPRVVLGSVPSFHEAKEATIELKHAIDKIYLSSNSSECDGSVLGSQVSVVSPHSELQNKSRVTEAISNPSPTNRAIQAFQLLSENPEAQSVVASIACDPNIWNAIVQNHALQDFFQSQQTAGGFEVEGTLDHKVEELSYSDSMYAFIDSLNVVHNVKLTVADMVTRVSNYLQNMFGFFTGQTSSLGNETSGNTNANLMDSITMGGTFMGLAVLVVMVIVLKRA